MIVMDVSCLTSVGFVWSFCFDNCNKKVVNFWLTSIIFQLKHNFSSQHVLKYKDTVLNRDIV